MLPLSPVPARRQVAVIKAVKEVTGKTPATSVQGASWNWRSARTGGSNERVDEDESKHPKAGMIWSIIRSRPAAYLIRFEHDTVTPIGGNGMVVQCMFIGSAGAAAAPADPQARSEP